VTRAEPSHVIDSSHSTTDLLLLGIFRTRRLLGCSGVARLSAVRGQPQKCRSFYPSNLLTKILNGSSCFVLIQRYKD